MTTTTTTTTTATYARLRDGSWGVRVVGPALMADGTLIVDGARVLVTRRSGEVREEYVGRVLWEGTDRQGRSVALCTLGDRPSPSRRSGGGCRTDGNCSSVGSGRSCGAPDCDGY